MLNTELGNVATAVLGRPRDTVVPFDEFPWAVGSLVRSQRIVNLPNQAWERGLFPDEWLQLVEWFDSQYDVQLSDDKPLQRDYFSTEFAAMALAATAAKSELRSPFGLTTRQGDAGMHPQHIRPVTVYASGGTAVENWLATAVVAGWNKAFWTIDLNRANAVNRALSTQNNVVMLILGIFDLETAPLLQEYQFMDNAGAPYGVESLTFLYAANNLNIYRLRAPFYIGLNSKATVDLNFTGTGNTIPGLWGMQFVTSQYFTAE